MVDRIKEELDWHYRKSDVEEAQETLERVENHYKAWLNEQTVQTGS